MAVYANRAGRTVNLTKSVKGRIEWVMVQSNGEIDLGNDELTSEAQILVDKRMLIPVKSSNEETKVSNDEMPRKGRGGRRRTSEE